jgi:hypothetical protein
MPLRFGIASNFPPSMFMLQFPASIPLPLKIGFNGEKFRAKNEFAPRSDLSKV